MKISNRAVIHQRLKCFVQYIAPDPDKREDVKRQVGEVRDCIERHARENGFTILASPTSGSFANKTGLRRSLQGNDEVEGQDVDIAFVLKDEDKDGNPLGCLVLEFESYLASCWPKSEVGHTKSSATIAFSGTKLSFDAVPLIETNRKDIQKLIRLEGKDRQSSVEKHRDFVKTRNESSNEMDGVVKFNECVRLIKWWRYQRQSESNIFGNESKDEKVPSFLLNLLCAKAYDELKVHKTYADTLKRWFGFLAHCVRERETIVFDDFIKTHKKNTSGDWQVIDPMDDGNNVTEKWDAYEIDELATWFEKGRDKIMEAIRRDEEGDDAGSLKCLADLFGNSIKNHCKYTTND